MFKGKLIVWLKLARPPTISTAEVDVLYEPVLERSTSFPRCHKETTDVGSVENKLA